MSIFDNVPQGPPKNLHAHMRVDHAAARSIPEPALRQLIDKELIRELEKHHAAWPALGPAVDQVWLDLFTHTYVFQRTVLAGGTEIR